MYKIYYNNRFLALSKKSKEIVYKDYNSTILYCEDAEYIRNAAQQFIVNENLKHLYIICSDYDRALETILQQFVNVEAAGGVVKNNADEILMILHRNVWDLPKGIQEQDEEIETCALREVCEETGITDISIERFICTTHHIYEFNGTLSLKHSHWYEMRCAETDGYSLSPQREEEISKVEWINRKDLQDILEESYPSIRDVFENI